MFRFIREWLKPKLKCERLDHDMRKVSRHGKKETSSYRCVADVGTFTLEECCRCGHRSPKETWDFDYEDYLTGMTMPSHLHSFFKKNGYLFDSQT